MILLDTYLSRSKIHGIGVFANTPIKKGSQICDYDSQLAKKFEVNFSKKEVLTYPKVICNFLYSEHLISRFFFLYKTATISEVENLCVDLQGDRSEI